MATDSRNIQTSSRAALADPDLAARLEIDGFVVVDDALSPEQLHTLRLLAEQERPESIEVLWSNLGEPNPSRNIEIDHQVRAALEPFIHQAFVPGVRAVCGNILIKGTAEDSFCDVHQDQTSIDERLSPSYSVWAPLVDVGPENGELLVAPGSHTLFPAIRSLASPSARLPVSGDVSEHLVAVPVRAGQAIVYSHALLHGSRANLSNAVRPVAVAGVFPVDAPHLLHKTTDLGELVTYELNAASFQEHFPTIISGGVPPDAKPASCETEWQEPASPAEVFSTLAGNDTSKTDAAPVRRSATLAATSQQQAFDRDGFVVVDLLDEASLADLAQALEAFPSGVTKGFWTSIHSNNVGHSRSADKAIRDIAGQACEDMLVEYRALAGAFVVKPPHGDGELSLHQDWTIVDESRFASVSIWCPVTELSAENGPMSVWPGSHHRFCGKRGSPGFPSPLDGYREQVQSELVTPTVRPGQAIVHDNRLIHGSGPNASASDRVAVTINMVPKQAQPRHLYRREDGAVEVFEVADAFFTDFRIGDRPEGTPIEVIEPLTPRMAQSLAEPPPSITEPPKMPIEPVQVGSVAKRKVPWRQVARGIQRGLGRR